MPLLQPPRRWNVTTSAATPGSSILRYLRAWGTGLLAHFLESYIRRGRLSRQTGLCSTVQAWPGGKAGRSSLDLSALPAVAHPPSGRRLFPPTDPQYCFFFGGGGKPRSSPRATNQSNPSTFFCCFFNPRSSPWATDWAAVRAARTHQLKEAREDDCTLRMP